MKNVKVEPTMKRILKDLGERHLTDDNSFLRQTLEKNLRITPESQKSQVRSWEKTWGLGTTQKKHR